MFCYASSAVNGGAKAGITTCSLSTDFIISVPDGADNEWKVSMYPTLKTYFFSDLFGFHDQYETLFDDAAESWIGIEKVFNLPTVDLKDVVLIRQTAGGAAAYILMAKTAFHLIQHAFT